MIYFFQIIIELKKLKEYLQLNLAETIIQQLYYVQSYIVLFLIILREKVFNKSFNETFNFLLKDK